jgi:hypothetical protein
MKELRVALQISVTLAFHRTMADDARPGIFASKSGFLE